MTKASADFLESFLESQRPLVSAQGYVKLADMAPRVLAWFDDEELELAAVGIAEAVRYQAWLSALVTQAGKPIATGTMHNYLKVARRLFDHLVLSQAIVSNPFLELRFPRMPEHISRNVLTEAQMGRLLRELESFDTLPVWYERERRYRVHVIAEFLYATGLRIAEACSLTEVNLDLEHRLVYVPQGKGGKPRTAFLTSYAADIMERYLSCGRASIMHGFTRDHAHTLFGAAKARVAEVVNGELKRVCERLGLPVITSHGFRHSLGTHLLRSGCDMRHIQVILGHEALQTTQVYTRVDKEDLKRSLDEFHPRHYVHTEAP